MVLNYILVGCPCSIVNIAFENKATRQSESGKLDKKKTEKEKIKDRNRPFAGSHSRGTKPPCWRAKVALGQEQQRKLPFKIMYAFYLSCSSATFALHAAWRFCTT